jgi:F420-dependent oxidoreductase-like protein
MPYAGFQIPSFTFADTPDARLFDRVIELATTAEDAGFDSVWVMDHFLQIPMVGSPQEPMLEGYTTLAALATRTSRVDLGTLVTGVTYRNPALLAKMVTTLDVISSGRALLGIGAAWFEQEHEAYGFAFPPVSERFERLEEALRVCRAMFREDAPSFEGRHASIHDAINVPRPVRAGGPPVLIGGSGERKTLRLVAEYGDYSNFFGDLEQIRRLCAVLDRHCEDVGRDPGAITRTRLGSLLLGPTAEEADERAAAARERMGVDDDTFRSFVTVGSPEQVAEQLGAYLAVGLDGHIVNLVPGTADVETVALAGEALARLR